MRRVIPFLVTLLVIAGCSNPPATVPETIPTGDHISRADAYVTSADGNVKAATPFANPTGKALHEQARKNLGNAKSELEKAEESNKAATRQIADLAAENQKQGEKLSEYKKQWVGDRAKLWTKIILASYVALGIAAMLLKTFAGGWLGTVGGQIIQFLPLANPFAWVGKAIERKRESDITPDVE